MLEPSFHELNHLWSPTSSSADLQDWFIDFSVALAFTFPWGDPKLSLISKSLKQATLRYLFAGTSIEKAQTFLSILERIHRKEKGETFASYCTILRPDSSPVLLIN